MIFKTIFSSLIPLRSIQRNGRTSRRDDTLLTVDFNLRTGSVPYYLQSPAGTALWRSETVSSLRDFWGKFFRPLRRLKPPVNKVSSLRDLLWISGDCRSKPAMTEETKKQTKQKNHFNNIQIKIKF